MILFELAGALAILGVYTVVAVGVSVCAVAAVMKLREVARAIVEQRSAGSAGRG